MSWYVGPTAALRGTAPPSIDALKRPDPGHCVVDGLPETHAARGCTQGQDGSRTAIREKQVFLPRRGPLVELSARHLRADETGIKRYRHARAGEGHFSMAFTCARLVAEKYAGEEPLILFL